jgi:hypothetical protein
MLHEGVLSLSVLPAASLASRLICTSIARHGEKFGRKTTWLISNLSHEAGA